MTEAAKELKDTKTNTPETEKKDDEDEAEDASSEDDSGADDEAGWGDIEDDNTPASRKGKQKKSKKGFSSVDKVSYRQPVLPIIGHSLVHLQLHAIVVDILRSEVKRKKIHHFIRKLCLPKHRHLVPIRGMKIRWNTTLAEISRGIELKPVCLLSYTLLSHHQSPFVVSGHSPPLFRLLISGLIRWSNTSQERPRQRLGVVRKVGPFLRGMGDAREIMRSA